MLLKVPRNHRRTPGKWSGWAFWQLSASLRAYLVVMLLAWSAAVTGSLLRTRFDGTDLATFGLLLAGGCFALEVTRKHGETTGTLSKDLTLAWALPIAFLLPPAYALLVPIPFMILTQWRVRQTLIHRRVLTMAVQALALAMASVVFHRVSDLWHLDRGGAAGSGLAWAAVALACAVSASLANTVLIAVAVKLNSPEEAWRELLLDRDNLVIDVGEICVGVMIGLLAGLQPLLVLLAISPVVLLHRAVVHDQLRAAARLDVKTGLLNAPTWEREAAAEVARAVRTGTPLSVMLLDLDHFKTVNDRYGHLTGDAVISAVAAVMSNATREYDVCARFGGDEFAILLPDSDLDKATVTAERIRRHVAATTVLSGDHVVQTSVSIGIAQLWSPDQGVTDLLAAADLSLYRAKEFRDQVHASGRDDERPISR